MAMNPRTGHLLLTPLPAELDDAGVDYESLNLKLVSSI